MVLPCGSILSKGNGNNEDSVHTVTSGARLVKSSDVTPNDFVSRAPNVDPAKAPPFSTLISVANSVASTPCAAIEMMCDAPVSNILSYRICFLLLWVQPAHRRYADSMIYL